MMHAHSFRFELLIYVFFALGTCLNVFRHASSVVNSSLNGISTYRKYFQVNGADQLFKVFGALCFLSFWNWHQTAVENLIAILWPGFLGTAPPGWMQGVFVVTPPTAGAFGLGWDVALDIVLVYLRKKYPQLNRDVPPTTASTAQKST